MKHVLVVGDVIIDEYLRGTPMGLSAETPTIVARLESHESFVGGAGLVARHLLRLGQRVSLLTMVGSDENVRSELSSSSDPPSREELSRLTCLSLTGPGWVIPRKRRCFVGPYKALQYDVLPPGSTEAERDDEADRIVATFRSALTVCDSVVVCDNRHGVMSYGAAWRIVSETRAAGKTVVVDSQVSQRPSNHVWYRGCSTMFLNERELTAVGSQLSLPSGDPFVLAMALAEELACDVVLKRGAKGALLASRGGECVIFLSPSVVAVDTCGAGDALLAAYVSLGDLSRACRWAALSTTFVGTVVPGKAHVSWATSS